MTSVLLHARLLASQSADDDTQVLADAVNAALVDLKRIERGIVYGRNPPGEFTRRKIASIASRLIQAAMAPEIAAAVELPADCEPEQLTD